MPPRKRIKTNPSDEKISFDVTPAIADNRVTTRMDYVDGAVKAKIRSLPSNSIFTSLRNREVGAGLCKIFS